MASTFKHNKKRNTGLVYEFLVRRLATHLLDSNQRGYKKTYAIVKKYFSKNEPLAREREVFEIIRSSRGLSENSAKKILEEVAYAVRNLDQKKIEFKKNNLIKELNYTHGKDFFTSHRLPDYRLLATVQLFIDGCTQKKNLTESVQKLQLEESLIRYMVSSDVKTVAKEAEEHIDSLVCTMVTKRFHEKYGNALNIGQKILLEKYTRSIMAENDDIIINKLHEDKENVLSILKSSYNAKEITEDKVMASRLSEAIEKLSSVCSLSRDNAVEEMMLYHKLVEELSK